MSVLGYIQISQPTSIKKTVSIKPTPSLKSSDVLKLFGFYIGVKKWAIS